MSRPTIEIVYDVPGWAYHHQAVAMTKFAPPGFELSLRSNRAPVTDHLRATPPDLIFCMCWRSLGKIREFLNDRGLPSILVGYWSLGWPCQAQIFEEVYDICDLLICNNLEYANRVGPRPRLISISNGVDLSVFRVIVPVQQRQTKVLWVGSEHHRRLKGYDDFIVPLFGELQERSLSCESRLVDSFGADKLTQDEMVEWYNTGTVLVCASEAEGTPNPVLEAAACGCAIVSTAVGNVPELIRSGINGFIVDRDLESLLEGISRACRERHRLVRQMSLDIQPWHWKYRVRRYFDEFQRVLEGKGRIARNPDPA